MPKSACNISTPDNPRLRRRPRFSPPQPTPISSASNRALHARVLRNAKECNRVCAAYDAAYSAPLHSLALSSSSSDEDELQAATANIDEAAAAISHATRAAQIPEPPVAPPRREATPQTHTPQTQTPALRPAADHHAAKAQLRELVRDVSLHLEASSLALADAAQLLARLDAAQPYEQTPEQAVTPRPHYHADSPSHSAHESITEFLTPEFLASFDPERRVPQSLQYDSASQMPPALSPPDS